MITRVKAVSVLTKNVGNELSGFADEYGITIRKEGGRINKGWKGHTAERMIGLAPDNTKAPNGLGYELKTVPYHERNGVWIPKETMAITMLNPDDLLADDFFHSHLWDKMKSLVFCVVSWDGKDSTTSTLLKVISLDFMEDNALIKGVKADYEFIRNKLRTQGFNALTSRDGEWIQARTKGAGHGSKSRAFYARKKFIEEICPPIDSEELEGVY